MIAKLGRKTIDFFEELGEIGILFFRVIKFTPSLIKHRAHLLVQMEHIGVNSLPLVIIIAVFTGEIGRASCRERV